MSIVESLSNVEVLDIESQPYRLGDAWSEQTAVLLFIRHFA